jgi:hypothetical protein
MLSVRIRHSVMHVTSVSCVSWGEWGDGGWGVVGWRCLMSLSTFFSVISLWSVLYAEETEVPGKNHQPDASHWQTLSHNLVSSTPRHEPDSNSQRYVFYRYCHIVTMWFETFTETRVITNILRFHSLAASALTWFLKIYLFKLIIPV